MADHPAIQLLADLVSVPSVNPMGRGGSGYGEQALAGLLADRLRRLGMDVRLQEVAPGRPNVLGYLDAGAEKTILLESHLDTVHVDTMTIPPFTPAIREGRLYGRGSCDTKGSMAAFLSGVESALRRGKLSCNVLFAGMTDEEYRFTGAIKAVEEGLRADLGIAGEPTQLRIVHAHKGVTRWKAVTQGLAAHSAYPDRGRNAIYTMGRLLLGLEQHAADLRGKTPHPMLGTPTLSVGVIGGGQAVNIVPDRCWAEVDRRTLPGESSEEVMRMAREALERGLLRGISDWEFEPPYLQAAGMEVPPEAPVVQLLGAAIARVTGEPARLEAANYATDAGTYNQAGIPTVVFGPGDIARAHTDAEYLEIDQLLQAARVIEQLLTSDV